jgi:hypothetical protein
MTDETDTGSVTGADGLWCPIVARRADRASVTAAQEEAVAWAERVGLLRTGHEVMWAAAWNVAEFAGRVYARSPDLSLAAQWIMWMDVIDDAVESMDASDIRATLAPITGILRHDDPSRPGTAAEPLVSSFADLWSRTRAGMSTRWRARVSYVWAQCADTMPWEAANRAAGRAPRLDDYLAHRSTAGATYLALLLNEALHRHELPDALYHSGPLWMLRALAGDHICWVNDLLSLEREERHGDVHNLVMVLEQSGAHNRSSAVRETVRMANERMEMIQQLTRIIPGYQHRMGLSQIDAVLMDRAADDILQWIAGSLEFHRLSTRHTDHHSNRANPFRISPQSGDAQAHP